MPETITLTTWERIRLASALGRLSGLNLEVLRKASNLLDKIEFTEEEKELVGLNQTINPNGTAEIAWKIGRDWDFELEEGEVQILYYAVNQFAGWSVSEYEQVEALTNKLAQNQKLV